MTQFELYVSALKMARKLIDKLPTFQEQKDAEEIVIAWQREVSNGLQKSESYRTSK